MKQQIKLAESAGRAVESVHCESWGRTAYVHFTDGTFAAIRAVTDYDGCAELETDPEIIPKRDRYDLVRAGVMSEAESAVIEAEEKRQLRAAEEQREQALYARLKAKYGE